MVKQKSRSIATQTEHSHGPDAVASRDVLAQESRVQRRRSLLNQSRKRAEDSAVLQETRGGGSVFRSHPACFTLEEIHSLRFGMAEPWSLPASGDHSAAPLSQPGVKAPLALRTVTYQRPQTRTSGAEAAGRQGGTAGGRKTSPCAGTDGRGSTLLTPGAGESSVRGLPGETHNLPPWGTFLLLSASTELHQDVAGAG